MSCLITAIALMIYHLGEEQVYAPSKASYKFVLFMEQVLKLGTCGTLDYLIPDFTEFTEKDCKEMVRTTDSMIIKRRQNVNSNKLNPVG